MGTPTLVNANTYHAARLSKETWEAADESRRQRALITAADDLAVYASSSNFESAVYEQAVWLLGDEAELAVNNITSIGLDGLTKSYKREGAATTLAPKARIALGLGSGGMVKTGRIKSCHRHYHLFPPCQY